MTQVRFRVLMNRTKADQFRYASHGEAKTRGEKLQKIFPNSKMEILAIEDKK